MCLCICISCALSLALFLFLSVCLFCLILVCCCCILFCSFVYLFDLICLFSNEKEKERKGVWIRVPGEVGRVWEKVGKGNYDQNILEEKNYSIKEEEEEMGEEEAEVGESGRRQGGGGVLLGFDCGCQKGYGPVLGYLLY